MSSLNSTSMSNEVSDQRQESRLARATQPARTAKITMAELLSRFNYATLRHDLVFKAKAHTGRIM